MRNIIKSILLLIFVAFAISCKDEALDPLQFEKVKKGTLLALRGDQLDAVYWNEEPYGASFFPHRIKGDETFTYDAEFLSADPTSLESVSIFVLKRVKVDKTVTITRVPLTTVNGSEFEITDRFSRPWATISISLSSILTALGETLDTPEKMKTFFDVYKDGVDMESDLNLKGGAKVLAADLVAAGLVESDQFYPAQKLKYGVKDIDDARPIATLSQRGQFSIVNKAVVRNVVPLRAGLRDTLNIVFDQAIDTPPSVAIDPTTAGTIGSVVPVKAKDDDEVTRFYVPFVANDSYTGVVKFVISGATSAVAGAQLGLVQSPDTEGIAGISVDNLAPVNTSFTTGTRVGKGQSATITLKFNEAIGTAPKVTIASGTTKIDGVTDVNTVLSSDKLTATYNYEYKDLDKDAIHGDATISISGGKDLAGNDLAPIASKPLTIDIGDAPPPTIVLDAQYDWGTQIKWTITYATGALNPGGATSGVVYYVAQKSGDPAPTGFVGGDVPAFKLAKDVSALQSGTVTLVDGTTKSVFSAFAPNGDLDVYAVIITSSGVISAITPVPTTVTMR